VTLTEQFKKRGRRPVLQRRLLEVPEAVQARRQPVAARHHLARDLAIAALVRLVERPDGERAEPQDREQDPEARRARRHSKRCAKSAALHARTSAAVTMTL